MKKILFAFMAAGLIVSASSCKKCGYCDLGNGNTESTVCKDNSLGPVSSSFDGYDQAKGDCERRGGTWVVTK